MNGIQTRWTAPADIRDSLEKKWRRGIFLCEAIEPSGLFPLRLPLKAPSAAELSSNFAGAREWIQPYTLIDKKQTCTVEWTRVNHRVLGRNELPAAVCFQDLPDLVRFLNKSKEFELFIGSVHQLLAPFPRLKPWILKNPFTLHDIVPSFEKLIRITQWMIEHPRPGIYLRQMSLEDIDTKFVEKHKKTLTEWFDILLDPGNVFAGHTGAKAFEQRFGFLSKPLLVRFRILDERSFIGGMSDITVRADEFCKLNLDIENVFVTENDINGLAFPNVKKSILLFGRGYGFESLENAAWLRGKRIWYWGDIDTHGFAILSQFRGLFPRAESLLMDRQTLLAHRRQWVIESSPADGEPANLTHEERSLYDDLRNNRLGNNIRLEQEAINYQLVRHHLEHFCDNDRARLTDAIV